MLLISAAAVAAAALAACLLVFLPFLSVTGSFCTLVSRSYNEGGTSRGRWQEGKAGIFTHARRISKLSFKCIAIAVNSGDSIYQFQGIGIDS